jgi:hypothetical protein
VRRRDGEREKLTWDETEGWTLTGLPATIDVFFSVSPFRRFAISLSPSLPRRLALAILPLVIFCLAAVGCGYHFAGTGGQAPGDIKSIAIDVLQNNTTEIGLENVFTNAIINQFVQWKRLPIKPRKEAEGVLGGAITGINTQEVSHVDSQKTLTTRLIITLKITLKSVETDEILWQRNYRYYDDYVETGNALDTAVLRRQASNEIAEYLAQKIYLDMFEEF